MTSQTFTIAQACRITGKARNTIMAKMENGVLSYAIDGNKKKINASELMRVFPDECNFDQARLIKDEKGQGAPSENNHQFEKELSIAQSEITLKDKLIRKLEDDIEFFKDELSKNNDQINGLTKLITDQSTQKNDQFDQQNRRIEEFEKMMEQLQENNNNLARQNRRIIEVIKEEREQGFFKRLFGGAKGL